MSAKRRRLISRISKQKMSAAESADDIRVADTLVPSQIGKILRHLPQHGMEVIIRHSTQHISKFYKDHKLLPMDLRYSWLLLVSELPSTKPVFFDAWRILDASGALRNQKLMSIVLLRHWISQGKVTHNPSLEQDIRHHALWGSDFGIGTMIALLDKRQENVRMEQGQLFKMLLVNRQFSTIYDVFSQFKALGMKMPIKTAARIVEAVSEHDHVLAFRIFQKCTAICFRGERMLAEFCPNFVLSMIHDPNIHPRRIWGIVNVPIYGELRHTCTKPRSTNRYIMTPAMAALLTNMAMAFAHCKNRSPGVILRNVTQCLRHLRRHRAPLNPRITRAITHASINLRIEFDKLVPQERADWALRMIRKVEGHKVAETVTMIVDVWNGHKRRNLR